jgi:hypothetical protein
MNLKFAHFLGGAMNIVIAFTIIYLAVIQPTVQRNVLAAYEKAKKQ